jgi:RNA polymerase sigma-70 factor (ECF subfamily)
LTDAEIIGLYWGRDQAAIAQTAKRYGNYCYSIAYRILGSGEDSEECLNDTWQRAWNAIPPQRPNVLSLFLGRITRNLAFDRHKMGTAQKRGGGELPLVLEELDECVPSPDSVEQAVERAIEGSELERVVNAFLHGLPERECDIFLLRYWHSYSLAEIGSRPSMRENNVKASLFRSRQKLRSYLEKEGVRL